MIRKILRLFVNTFTAYDKSSVLDTEYLTHPIHMQPSQKQRAFSEFFSNFFYIYLTTFSEVRNFENRLALNVTFFLKMFKI